jgi:hypothetical protein
VSSKAPFETRFIVDALLVPVNNKQPAASAILASLFVKHDAILEKIEKN